MPVRGAPFPVPARRPSIIERVVALIVTPVAASAAAAAASGTAAAGKRIVCLSGEKGEMFMRPAHGHLSSLAFAGLGGNGKTVVCSAVALAVSAVFGSEAKEHRGRSEAGGSPST